MNHDTKSLLKSQVCSTFFIIFIGFHLIVGGIRYNPLTFIAITSSVNEFKQTIYVDNINRLFIVSVSSPLSMVHSRSTKQHHWWPRMFDPVYFSRSPFVTMDFHYYLDGKEEGQLVKTNLVLFTPFLQLELFSDYLQYFFSRKKLIYV